MSAMPDPRVMAQPDIMGRRKRGLFGVPSMVPGMGDAMAPERMPTMAAQEQPQKPKTNWAGVLSDFLGGMVGQPARFAMAQQEQRQFEQQTRARQHLAEAQRAAEMQDYTRKKEIDAQYRGTEYDALGKKLMQFGIQPGSKEWQDAYKTDVGNDLDPLIPVLREGPGGTFQTAVRRSDLLGSGAGSGRPAIGSIVPDPFGDSQPMSAPNMLNTPAPATGPSGMPQVISSQQYHVIVSQKGKAETDAMLARNNIQVR